MLISNYQDVLLTTCVNVFLMEDFNADRSNANMDDFCQLYSLKHLISITNCCKNPDNPSIIDLVLTNAHRSF